MSTHHEECACCGAHEHQHDEHEHECHGHDHDHECDCHTHGCDHDHDDHDHHHHRHHHDHEHDHGHDHVPTRELSAEPTFTYHVLGVDCPSCALGVQNAVRSLSCVDDARLVYATATLEVVASHDASVVDCKREVLQTVRSCGEDLELSEAELKELEAERSWFAQNREKVLMGLSALFLVAGLVSEHLLGNDHQAIPFYVAASLAGLVFIAPMALASLRRRTADMNVLMGIAVIGALIIGFTGDPEVFGDAAIVIFLDQVGEWLEGWSMRKTSGSVRELMDLAPSVAHVVTPEGTTVDVQTKGVEEGYTIRVLPGERVPLDGTIVIGASSFNEAPVTGESVPQDKTVGAEVYAGSLNTNAVVDLLVTADEDCTTLARIVSQVQGAQAEKAPYESFVNRFAAAYTPIVIAGAIVLGLCVPLSLSIANGAFDLDVWHYWLYRACSLLVVACPCALVISTPVSFVSALSCAARNGVLVKGGAHFDMATKVTHVAFDKTGTLTTGEPTVTEIVTIAKGTSAEEILAIAATLESSSTHPLARAVVSYAHEQGIVLPQSNDVEELTAQGMSGIVGEKECIVGKVAFAQQNADVTSEVWEACERLGATGATALVVVADHCVLGVVGIADTLREVVPGALNELRAQGRNLKLEMLTGDNAFAAQAIAQQAGIDEVAAELLPDHKLGRIAELQKRGEVVAMVGDGINDAPALAKADLGITMGAAASDTALEVADVALMSDDLAQLPLFFHLARRTMNIVRENIAFAIGVKVLVFVLVSIGVAGMGAAVFADTGVALLVVVNGMRVMRAS